MNLIGNINAIPFRRFRGGGGVAPFPSIPGMIARYSALGLTNEQMKENPVWVDKTGNGHDLQMKNFLWGGMSGVGGYGDENYQTFYKFTLDDYVFIASPPGVKHMNFTFRVTGLQPRNKLTLAFFGTTNTVYGTWNKDGIYTVDADIVEAGKPTYFYNGYGSTRGEFTIEILPLYPGALVFDGVDDYGTCDNFPILTKEKGYTVVALRQWISMGEGISGLVSNVKNWFNDGAFVLEYFYTKNLYSISFGAIKSEKDLPHILTYQTSKSYNGVSIVTGNFTGTDVLYVGKLATRNVGICINAAIWELVFLDHDATEEELTKIKDYFVKTYPWLFPDQAWTVTGKTNEDEDRATIANITGNGNDLVCLNLGFIEGSGYNEEGEYAGYLVTDGVDDKITSSSFGMGKDFTIVGEWKFIDNKKSSTGLVKGSSFYIYNTMIGLDLYINSGSVKNSLDGIKSINAACSDGRAYDRNWNEILANTGNVVGSGGMLEVSSSGGRFDRIAFKNLAIYPRILSKDDCIKAYNYLQTLKAK